MTTRLSLPNICIRRVPNLSTFPLEEIDLQGNRLMSLEDFPLTVKSLNVSHNSLLGDGIFFPFPRLRQLNISHNRVNVYENDEFVFCFPALETLDISYNCLKHTGFLRDSSVKELNVSHNRIHLLSGLPLTLTNLTADTNEITMIQSKLPPTLEQIALSYNRLRFAGLPFNWPSTLRELHLDHNNIETFPRKLPESLEVLTLSENQLTALPPTLPASLQYFVVSSNRIRTLPHYKGHKKFCIFAIDNNCLTEVPRDIHATVFQAEDNWNEEAHQTAQRRIKQCWKRYVLTLRLRHLIRTKTVQDELFMVSMMPERWDQVDVIDPVWFRKTLSHSRTDHPKD
jgi:Leucine-rich repeat (LRR) protein